MQSLKEIRTRPQPCNYAFLGIPNVNEHGKVIYMGKQGQQVPLLSMIR